MRNVRRRRHSRTPGIVRLVALAASLAVSVTITIAVPSIASTATPSSRTAAHRVALTDANKTSLPLLLTCAGSGTVRPASFVVDCQSSRSYLTGVHWSTWTTKSATGSATLVTNACTPSCQTGHITRVSARVAARSPIPGRRGEVFYLLTLTYTVSGKSQSHVWIDHHLFVSSKK